MNGFPARLVVPGWVATYWMKHLNQIEISAKPLANFWMKTAYRVPAGMFPATLPFRSQAAGTTVPITEMVVNSLIADPLEGSEVERDGFQIQGVAWDRGSGIGRVEVSLDGGATWIDALLDRPLGPYAFRRFSLETDFLPRGRYRLASRATSNAGERQPESLRWNPGGYHNNAPRVITVTVT
nr:molybdopterin-dependent oxidoreductase [Rhodopila globiformis]